MKSKVLIIMKPDALERGVVAEILKRFIDNQFKIEMISYQDVNETIILRHYAEVIEKLGPSFAEIMKNDYVGKSMIPIILSQDGSEAIKNARQLTGATDPSQALAGTIRGDLGLDSLEEANRKQRSCQNLIHCCDSEESLKREMAIWFDDKTISWLKKTRSS